MLNSNNSIEDQDTNDLDIDETDFDSENSTSNNFKLDARRRLEEYLDNKRLEKELEYFLD